MFSGELPNTEVWTQFIQYFLQYYLNREISYTNSDVWRMQLVNLIKSYKQYIESNATSAWKDMNSADNNLVGRMSETFDSNASDSGKSTNTSSSESNSNGNHKNRTVNSEFPQSNVTVGTDPVSGDVYKYASNMGDYREASSNTVTASDTTSSTSSRDSENKYNKIIEDSRAAGTAIDTSERKMEFYSKYMREPFYKVITYCDVYFMSQYIDEDRYGWLTTDELNSSTDLLS